MARYAAVLSLVSMTSCTYVPPGPVLAPDLAALQASVAKYSTIPLANAAGYNIAFTDCLSKADSGSMGLHYANTELLDATVDSLHPEALVFEPAPNGAASLVGVEFIVPYTAVPKRATAPVLFGQSFSADDGYQVWGLHVWTERRNPNGMFASWNPRVHCSSGRR